MLCKFHDSEFLGFDWSQYCHSLLATYSQGKDVVRFWNLHNSESEQAKQKLLEGNMTKAKSKNRGADGTSQKGKTAPGNTESATLSSHVATVGINASAPELNIKEQESNLLSIYKREEEPAHTKVHMPSGDVFALACRQRPTSY